MSIDLTNFNYNEFKAEAIEKIKSGQPLTGKGGILTPLTQLLSISMISDNSLRPYSHEW